MSKNVVLLLDGTWNNSIAVDRKSSADSFQIAIDDESTNIARMWQLLKKSASQVLIYQRGVGTDSDWGDSFDGMFGKQVNEKADQAFDAMRQHIGQKTPPGDTPQSRS